MNAPPKLRDVLGETVIYHAATFPQSHKPIVAIVVDVTGDSVTLFCVDPRRSRPSYALRVPHRGQLDPASKARKSYWEFRPGQVPRDPDGVTTGAGKNGQSGPARPSKT